MTEAEAHRMGCPLSMSSSVNAPRPCIGSSCMAWQGHTHTRYHLRNDDGRVTVVEFDPSLDARLKRMVVEHVETVNTGYCRTFGAKP